MRVPLSWLRDFVDIPSEISAEELAEKLTLAGLEVGKVHYIGIPQSQERYGIPPSDHLVWDRAKILLGYITEVKQHPNADRLVLAVVDYGASEPETVVTGAPNLFDYVNQGPLDPPLLSPFALEGAEVIDGHADGQQRMILEERELRGIPNRCMVCSEMELGISGEHEGIMLLDYEEFSNNYAPGTPFVDVLGDIILDIDLTPNLARCFSILGVAREVAALLNIEAKEPDYSLPETGGAPIDEAMAGIDIHEPELNPRFTAGLLRNVTIGDSPGWIQRRLKMIGQRPINNIVDVTNYVMFEIGQPTHAFDYDILQKRVNGGKPTIITRLPEGDKELTTLDGKKHQLQDHQLLVADTEGPLSFAGLMGGLESEVQEPDPEQNYPGSQTVLLEAAAWNLITIRKTMSSTKLFSEAAARFSRGVHPEMALRGLLRGLKLMAEVSGATLAPGIIDEYPAPPQPVRVKLYFAEVERILGFHIPGTDVINILRNLQFEVEEAGDEAVMVTMPDHRLDIDPDPVTGQADLIEEIARIYGYNRIPNTQIGDELPTQHGNLELEREETVRDLLALAGLQEVINYRFTTPQHEALLTPDGHEASWDARGDYVHIANPISVERTALRQTLLAGLLDNAVTNMNFRPRQQLFEIGPVFYTNSNGELPAEPLRLGILMSGPRETAAWMGDASTKNVDFYDLKGVVETLLAGMHVTAQEIEYRPIEHNTFHPGRVAQLVIGGQEIGVLGEIHPLVREAFGLGLDLERPVLAAEIDLERLLAYIEHTYQIVPIPTHPPVYRDIAVVVPADRLSSEVEAVIWQSGGELLREVNLFDVYSGDPIPAGRKSLAYSMVFVPEGETLTDKQVNKIQKKIVDALAKTGAELRA